MLMGYTGAASFIEMEDLPLRTQLGNSFEASVWSKSEMYLAVGWNSLIPACRT